MKSLLIKNLLLLGLALVISCSGGSKNSTKKGNIALENGKIATPEISDKNSPEYQSAFVGQTRIDGVKTSTEYQVELINKDLGKPWGIINLPDGRFLSTEKLGFMNIVSSDGKTIIKVEGLPKVEDKGQGGLLGVALDPEFAANRMIYFTYSEPVKGGNPTSISKAKLSNDEKKV